MAKKVTSKSNAGKTKKPAKKVAKPKAKAKTVNETVAVIVDTNNPNPPAFDPKLARTERNTFLSTKAERDYFDAMATKNGMVFSEWARRVLLKQLPA